MKIAVLFKDWRFKNINVIETLLVAFLYILTARIGQSLAIEPGNVTPVWIPSGLMLALALKRGPQIWLGVFLGAFAGNVWAYFTLASLTTSIAAIFAGVMNGIGDVFSTVLMASFILHYTQSTYPFTSLKHFSLYILFSVVIGSFISALFGATGLYIFGFLPSSNYFAVFSTWFIGDGVGALIFGPLLLAWMQPIRKNKARELITLASLVLISGFATAFIFDLLTMEKWMVYLGTLLLPVLLFICVSYEQKFVFTVQATVSIVCVYATSNTLGPFAHGSTNQALLKLQIFIAIFSLIIYVIALLTNEKERLKDKLLEQKQKLESLYRLDALTGIWNRYRINEFINFELSRYKRGHQSFGIMMLDIDNFKEINDSHGHLVGDKVLVKLCKEISTHIRDSDLFGRWGGEEFLIIIPNSTKDTIMEFAEKIRSLVEIITFDNKIKVTVSIGVTINQVNDTELRLIDRVDAALSESKASQKNCITFL